MAEDTWIRDKADVVKNLALVEQALRELAKDVVGMRTEICEALAQIRADLKAQEREFAALRDEHIRRCAQADVHDEQIRKLRADMQAVEKLMPAVRGVLWVGGILGGLIAALIWGLITGQVSLNF